MTQEWLKQAIPVEPIKNDWLKTAVPVDAGQPAPIAGIQSLSSDLPSLPKRIIKGRTKMFGGEPTVVDLPEDDTSYKKRLGEYYGFTAVPEQYEDNYGRLQEVAGFTPSRQEDMQRIVKKAFGGKANLANYEGYPDPVIVFDTGEIVPFNQPGLTMQDVRGAKAATGVLAAEIGGAALGLLGGPFAPATVPLGVGSGAFAGEYARLKKGQKFSELTDSEIVGRAAIDAAIATGLEIATLGAGAVVRRFITGKAGKQIVGDLTETDIESAVRAADNYAAETGQTLTAGQAVQQAERMGDIAGKDLVAAEMRTVEEVLAKSGVAPGLRTQLGEQRAALTAGVREAEEVAAEDLMGTAEVGSAIQEEAKRDVAATARDIMQGADIRRGIQEKSIAAEITAPELLETSEGLRTYIEGAKDATFENLSRKYEDFWAAIPDETVNAESVRELATEINKKLNKDFIKKLTEEDKSLVEGIIGEKGEQTFESVSRAISQLKAEKRAMSAGLPAAARQKSMVNDLINSLEEARDDALRDIDPDLREELRVIDTQYAIANKEIYGSLLGRMIAKNKQGGYAIGDDKLFEKFARQPTEVRNLAGLINDSEFAGFGGTSLIKDGFNSLYRDRVVDGTMKHSTFMRQFGPSMKKVLSVDEMKKFDSFATTQRNITLIDKVEKNEIKELSRKIGYKLQNYNAEDVLDNVKGSVSKVKEVKRILSRSPDKWDDFKRLYARDFLNSVMKDGDFGPEFSVSKLGSMLKADKGELTEVLGKRYVNDLGWLKSQAEVIGVPKTIRGATADILKETPPLNPIMAIWRATIARPLSREGLLTTGAIKMIRRGSRKALGEVLQNPKNLRKLHQLYVKDAPLRKWRSFFRSIGYNEMVDAMQEKEE